MLAALPVLFPISFALLLVVERVFPDRKLPAVRGWLLKGSLFFLMALILRGPVAGALAGMTAGYAPVDLRDHPILGFLALVLTGELLGYWTHRLMHRSDRLWRAMHQLHHSAERIDVAGFTYAHPLETIIAVLQGVGIATIFGVSPIVAFCAGYTGFFLAVMTHLNVKTPRWLGFVMQRPEQHCIHHERGVHAYNYGLPLFDMLFGTFRNPARWAGETGFYDGASKRTWAMLVGRDIAKPAT